MLDEVERQDVEWLVSREQTDIRIWLIPDSTAA